METREKEKFYEVFTDVMDLLITNIDTDYGKVLEIYYSILALFLSFLNRFDLAKEAVNKFGFIGYIKMDNIISWRQIINNFKSLADWIFVQRINHQDKMSNDIIEFVQKYINENLEGDLSLTVLSELVDLNPAYLCRLYKEITGSNLSQYINEMRIERAKELLINSNLKIYEVAKAVGYYTVSNFNRFFKKEVNITPGEYRQLKYLSRSL